MRFRLCSTAALCVLTAVALAGCTSGGAGPTPPQSVPVTPTTAMPSSPGPSKTTSGPVAPKYVLSPTSRLTIQVTGAPNTKSGGELTVTNGSGGSTQIQASAATGSKANNWTLDLTISSAGKALSGTISADGRLWNVQPNTGSLGSVITNESVALWTALALTVVPVDGVTNSPVTLSLTATNPSPSTSPTAANSAPVVR